MSELRPRHRPSPAVRRRRIILIASVAGVVVLAVVVAALFFAAPHAVPVASPSPTPSATPTASATPTPTPTPTPTQAPAPAGFDKTANSIDDPNSIWVVVNKQRPLNPANFEAADLVAVPVPYVYEPRLRQAASDAIVAMFAAITAETGLSLQSQSAYRSYDTQVSVYQGWVDQLGQTAADLTSARPGYSEHQTGLAIDVNSLPDAGCGAEACWATAAEAPWVAANAWRFGFIVRYPDGKTAITGYEYEPWHLRYVGTDLSTEMHNTGVSTLEEFFGLPAAPSY